MGQLNIKDEALIAEAKALAELLGTSATDAVRQAVHERLARERAGREAEQQRRKSRRSWRSPRVACARLVPAGVMSNAEPTPILYDENGVAADDPRQLRLDRHHRARGADADALSAIAACRRRRRAIARADLVRGDHGRRRSRRRGRRAGLR